MEITTETIIFAIIALALLIVTVVFSVILIFAKKEKRKEMKKSKITAGISAILTPCMLFAAIASMHTICPPPPPPVERLPSLIGCSYKECKEEYSDKFEIIVEEEQYSFDYPEGAIIEQKPFESSEYYVGDTTVKCKISKGPRMVEVSNVIGLDFEDANNILGENDRFTVGFVSEYSDDVPKGKVIATDPPEFERVVYGSTIKVIVSGGREPDVSENTE